MENEARPPEVLARREALVSLSRRLGRARQGEGYYGRIRRGWSPVTMGFAR